MAITENETCRLAGRHSNDILLWAPALSMFVAVHKFGRDKRSRAAPGTLAGENVRPATPTLAWESHHIVGLMTVNTTSRAADSFLSTIGGAFRWAGRQGRPA
jgi:hypothetical protein